MYVDAAHWFSVLSCIKYVFVLERWSPFIAHKTWGDNNIIIVAQQPVLITEWPFNTTPPSCLIRTHKGFLWHQAETPEGLMCLRGFKRVQRTTALNWLFKARKLQREVEVDQRVTRTWFLPRTPADGCQQSFPEVDQAGFVPQLNQSNVDLHPLVWIKRRACVTTLRRILNGLDPELRVKMWH